MELHPINDVHYVIAATILAVVIIVGIIFNGCANIQPARSDETWQWNYSLVRTTDGRAILQDIGYPVDVQVVKER